MDMANVVVHLKGVLADLAGTDKLEITGIQTAGDILLKIKEIVPEATTKRFVLMVDRERVDDLREIKGDEEITLIPPFTGG
jgi:molybdopterin converting factor small subunit